MKRGSLLSRRAVLRGVAAGGLLPLAGCSLNSRDPAVMSVLDKAESLTKAVQRALLAPRLALAPEYPPGAITPYFKPNGSIDPDDPDYVALKPNGFANWKLAVAGLVERPMSLSLAELRALPSRSQITRHDCVEGWSCIGQWKGAQLSALLAAAGLKPQARFIAFFCADTLEQTLDDTGRYYEFDRPRRRLSPPDHSRLRDELCAAQGRARRPLTTPGRTPARLQDGEIRDAHRGDRQLRRPWTRARRLLGRPRLRMVRGDLTGRVSLPPSTPPQGTRGANRAAALRASRRRREPGRSRSCESRRRSPRGPAALRGARPRA